MTISLFLPSWLLWAAGNLSGLVAVFFLVYRQVAAVQKRQAAEFAAREAYHVKVHERMEREAAALQAQLDSHASLWLVGRHVRGNHWDVQGIFSTREKAVSACKSARYFIFPLALDQELPEGSSEPFALEYPKGVND
jgi:hypothetical protein